MPLDDEDRRHKQLLIDLSVTTLAKLVVGVCNTAGVVVPP
jgi:hypothetical protein